MASPKIERAKREQKLLSKNIDPGACKADRQFIAGADISFNLHEPIVYAAMVVLQLDNLEPVEEAGISEVVSFPYIPGYLSFREVPSLLKVWKKLKIKPGIIMLDGHGIIHPRKMGLATHFGLAAGIASMGCAKKPFVGEYEEVASKKGSYGCVNYKNEPRGWVYRSKDNVKPVYVSPGTGMSLQDSLALAQQCTGKYRILEPTRQAHLLSNRLRRGESIKNYTF